MTGRRALRAWLSIPIVLGILTLLPAVSQATSGSAARPDIEVAIRDPQGCRRYDDNLPTLFLAFGLNPGQRTARVESCVRNHGPATGRLTLRVFQRIDTDLKCSGDEALVDASCAFGRPGELGPNLMVLITVRPACGGPNPAPMERRLVALESVPALLDPALARDRVDCVGLQVEFRPTSVNAAVAAQTDNVLWRFAFDLSS